MTNNDISVGLFDTNEDGMVDYNEFQQLVIYYQHWLGVFEQLDANKTGYVSHSQLYKTLQVAIYIYIIIIII